MSENSNIVHIENTINLSREKLSDNGRLIPESHIIEIPDLDDNGNERFTKIDGEMVTSSKSVACMALEIPTRSELAAVTARYWDNIQTAGNFGTGSNFGSIKSLDHKNFTTRNGNQVRRGCKVNLGGVQYTLEISLTHMTSQAKPYGDQEFFKMPLHRAGYRLVIDQNNDSRQFYHLWSDKPAGIEEVASMIGDEAYELLNGSTARTGA
tara:strand:- start:7852 stop:8478 length:627 start_codon:yes stop_codon:yes gene_type:complete